MFYKINLSILIFNVIMNDKTNIVQTVKNQNINKNDRGLLIILQKTRTNKNYFKNNINF